ncbi:MAG TPA: ATP synthase F0 subunit B [Candidatus Binatia bacterium]|jgi:F-type H+-transporting ATPase subunit b
MSGDALRAAVALASIGITTVAPVLAAEEGAETHGGEHEHVPGIGDLLFPAINFALFAVILVKYVVPNLRVSLQRRASDITDAAASSRAVLQEAEGAMTAARSRMQGVAAEREAIRNDLVTAANRHAERVHQQAEETGKRRLADAELVAEQERRRALAEVRAEIAASATALAESRLRASLSSDDQRTFVQQFLKDAPRP